MSYDLSIATSREPARTEIPSWAERAPGIRARHEGPGPAGGWELERHRLLGWRHVALVDAPVRAEAGDLHELLRAGVREPAWLMEVHLPLGASEEDKATATALATHLAETFDGAVFDPQREVLLWPAAPVQPVRRPRESRIRLVRLEWFIPLSRVEPVLPWRLVELLGEHSPEGLPRRYGSFEPMQERFEGPTRVDRFAAFWNDQAAMEFAGNLFWSTKQPFHGGSATFPDRRERFRPPGAGRMVRIGLGLDGTRVAADERWLERTVGLFAVVAASLDAAYGHGFVERNVILRRRIWYGRDSEIYPQSVGPWFVGLPDAPMWLGWFGPEYAPLVGPAIPEGAGQAVGSSLFVRRGRMPMDLSELREVPPLPPELVIARREGGQRPAAVVPVFE